MMTRRMQRMMQKKQGAQQEGAPRQAMLMGEPHMLAYINEAERQMLKRAGGAEAPGPEGIPVYGWWSDTFGGGNSFSQSVANTFTPNDGTTYVGGTLMNDYEGPNIDGSSGYAVDNVNSSGSDKAYTYDGGSITDAGKTITNTDGSVVTLSDQQANFTDKNYNTTGDNLIKTDGNGNVVVTNTDTNGGGGGGTTATPVNQALLDALARRDAALAQQMGAVATAFGFSTDDYYNQLGTDYREGGLSEAFTTAYDDAIRGIYDVYKSAGMLTQSDVNDDLGILAGANSGEEGRMDSIVDQYTTANRNYVTEGRGGIEGELQGFVTDTEDIPTIDAQTAQILGYDVPGKSQPYKTPQEGEVVEFFTDFVKRAYDPSYNVDPTAIASGGPKKVSGSVDQLGAGTQPSTIAGILDPVKGGSVKVVG